MENLYKQLVDASDTGFAYYTIINNREGFPIDYVYEEMNPSFQSMIGVNDSEFIGKQGTQIQGDLDKELLKLIKDKSEDIRLNSKGDFELTSFIVDHFFKIKIKVLNNKNFIVEMLAITQAKNIEIELKDVTKLQELERALSEQRYLMNSLMDNTSDIIYIKNTEGKYLLFNKAAETLSGKKAVNVLGNGVDSVFPPHIAADVMLKDKDILEKREIISSEEKVLNASGEVRIYLSTKGPIIDKDGILIGMFGISRDITDRIKREKDLEKSEKQYRWVTENAADVIFHYNVTNKEIVYISPSIVDLLGFSHEEIMTHTLKETIVPESYEAYIETVDKNLAIFMNNPEEDNHFTIEAQVFHKNGSKIWIESSTRYQYNSLGEIDSVSMIRSIEERIKAREAMRQLSYYDQLTGLYNRRFYEEELSRLNVAANLPMALVMADLNGLKLTNDAFGHQEGDIRLKKIAKILKKGCTKGELVARIGGDEFVIVMPNSDEKDARDLIDCLNKEVINEKVEHGILSLSIGYSIKETMSDDIKKTFKKAEADMYRHKLAESSNVRSRTINQIMETLYDKSYEEMLHSKRVAMLCTSIASKMNCSKDECSQIEVTALVHDIGKIGVSNKLLDKKEPLTDDEWLEIKKHSEVGYHILGSVKEFSEMATNVLSHHERMDGKGYPQGLKGESIPIQSRIIAVADAYEAMTSERPYGRVMSREEAITELLKHSGSQFDPEIVKVFVEKVLPDFSYDTI